MTTIPPIVEEGKEIDILEEKRQRERRSDWHTPADCFKLLDVQDAMKGVNERLDKGHERMCDIESTIDEVKVIIEKGAESHTWLREKLAANNSETAELLEIIRAGKGFFKTVGVLGDVLKWVLGLGAAAGGAYLTWKSGGKL